MNMGKKPEEKRGGISDYRLEIFRIMEQRYKTKNRLGKACYDIAGAIKNESLIRMYFKNNPWALSDMLYRVRKLIERGYVNAFTLEGDPLNPVRTRDVLGDIEKHNRLCEEITGLVLSGEDPRKHSRRLQIKYRMTKKQLEETWDDIQGQREKMSPREARAWQAWEETNAARGHVRQNVSKQNPAKKEAAEPDHRGIVVCS